MIERIWIAIGTLCCAGVLAYCNVGLIDAVDAEFDEIAYEIKYEQYERCPGDENGNKPPKPHKPHGHDGPHGHHGMCHSDNLTDEQIACCEAGKECRKQCAEDLGIDECKNSDELKQCLEANPGNEKVCRPIFRACMEALGIDKHEIRDCKKKCFVDHVQPCFPDQQQP